MRRKGGWGEPDPDDLPDEVTEFGDEDAISGLSPTDPEPIGPGSGKYGPLGDNEKLERGDLIRTSPHGATYQVLMVNESRVNCTLVPERGRFMSAPSVLNISPKSGVIRVRRSDLRNSLPPETRTTTEERDMATAGIPVATKSNREKEKERRGRLAGRARKTELTGAAAKASARAKRVTKPPQTVRSCACGCGDETSSYFVPGHDARFKSFMVKVERGTMAVDELPKAVQKAYEFKAKGKGFVSTTNYKGEPHKGYDSK